MAYGTRAPLSAQRLTATSGRINPQRQGSQGLGEEQLSEEEKKRRRQMGGGAPGQQAPWATPGSTATTSGGSSRNPFSGSVYARPAQTMQGPTVASVSAKAPTPTDTLPLWQKLTQGSSPGAPGGGSGGMFAPTFGSPGGGGGGGGQGAGGPQFMQTIAMGPPPSAPKAPSIGGISLGGGGGGFKLPGPGAEGPGGDGGPQMPQMPPGGLGGILGAMMPQQNQPPKQQGGSKQGPKPYEAPEPGDANWKPPSMGGGGPQMGQGPLPPVASLLPPPAPMPGPGTMPSYSPPQNTLPGGAPVPNTGTQYNGSGYQPQAGASGDRTPPGTVYRWGPNGYGYYPV